MSTLPIFIQFFKHYNLIYNCLTVFSKDQSLVWLSWRCLIYNHFWFFFYLILYFWKFHNTIIINCLFTKWMFLFPLDHWSNIPNKIANKDKWSCIDYNEHTTTKSTQFRNNVNSGIIRLSDYSFNESYFKMCQNI